MAPSSEADGIRSAIEGLLARHHDGILPIVQAGHPVLRRPAHPVDDRVDATLLRDVVTAMSATMRAAPGVGLAAPQVGVPLALAVLEDPGDPDPDRAGVRERAVVPFRVLVNPRYDPLGDEVVAFYEGCLSVRGYQAVRSRWRRILLTCEDLGGVRTEQEVTGWAARIVQHECDHLAGVLYLDGAEPRSLCSESYLGTWASEPTPRSAAAALGFDLTTGPTERSSARGAARPG